MMSEEEAEPLYRSLDSRQQHQLQSELLGVDQALRYQSMSDNEVVLHRSDSPTNSRHGIRPTNAVPTINVRRSKSLCAFQLNEYTLGEIRRLHERLAARQPGISYGIQKSSLWSLGRTQKMALASLCLVDFISFCSMSIMAPFFPKEAASKGMTETTAGLVFGFYAFVIFLSSPVFGKILPRVGAKFLFMSGLFVAGSCNFLFGLLGEIEETLVFTVYCFLVRGLEAVGASAYSTATYVFVVEVFPSNVGAVLGILETFVGLGMSMGPALGGFLYSVGGFGLPFYSLGFMLVLTLPVNMCLLPSIQANNLNRNSGSAWQIMLIPSVFVVGLVIIITSCCWGFLDPTLEPHLRQFNLTPEKIGLIFLLFSGLYGVASPVWGYVSDKCDSHWFMMTAGLVISALSLFLLGPAPFLPFLTNSLWLNLVSLSLFGISTALVVLPTFQGILRAAVSAGQHDELQTHSLVAGAWSSLYALGEMIGPLLGGAITEHYGFPICCTVMAVATITLAILTFLYFVMAEGWSPGSRGGSTTKGDSYRDSGCDSGVEDVLDYSRETRPLLTTSNPQLTKWRDYQSASIS